MQQITQSQTFLGKLVNVQIDRPLGSRHPDYGFIYEVNYGFIPNTISGDGEELDAYILGPKLPLKNFTGRCIAIIHRTNDNDDKLIVVPDGVKLSDEIIERTVAFRERNYTHQLIR